MPPGPPPHPATLGRPPARRGRPATITRQQVAAAALQVGFDRVTMASVAAELGVSHAALYSHVADRADLVAAAIDHLVEVSEWPAPVGPWRGCLEGNAQALWRLLERDPALAVQSRVSAQATALLGRFNVVVEVLMEEGFAPADALLATDTVFDLAHDVFVHGRELNGTADGPPGGAPEPPSWVGALPEPLRAPTLSALADPHRWFDRKLAVVLDGIEASLAPSSRAIGWRLVAAPAHDAEEGTMGDVDGRVVR